MNAHSRQMIDGMFRYDAVVVQNGRQVTPTVYTDWFTDDVDAKRGLRQIMESQGYTVARVLVGRPGETGVVEIG